MEIGLQTGNWKSLLKLIFWNHIGNSYFCHLLDSANDLPSILLETDYIVAQVVMKQSPQLSSSVADLEAQAAKFKEVYEKLKKENEKLAEVRDQMQEQLDVSFCSFYCSVT